MVWHISRSSPSPTQEGTALPLLVSASVEHSRFLLRDPVPHVAEQGDQEPHGFQLEQGPECRMSYINGFHFTLIIANRLQWFMKFY